jgi:hypothetical protein
MGFIMTCVLGNAGMWRCRTGFLIVTKGVPDLSLFRAADKSRLHLFSRPPVWETTPSPIPEGCMMQEIATMPSRAHLV